MALQPDRYFSAADDEFGDPATTRMGNDEPAEADGRAEDDGRDQHSDGMTTRAFADDPDVIIAEVVAEEPTTAGQPAAGQPVAGQVAAQGNGTLSPQWHDIQAMFVDDPRGSVRLAAAAADAAVADLVDSLRQRQNALQPAGADGPSGAADRSGTEHPSGTGHLADTEQLREALRSYRVFCEAVADLSHRLPQTSGVAS